MPGFDFRVQYSSLGRPTCIMWMTALMRYNLKRFSHILFLDAQKRQMNKVSWPYIGPSVLNSENRVAVVSESIVTSEDLETYTWLIKAMLEIEPMWSLSLIDIIYSDGFMTNTLLTNLGIENSCILHGDYYHLYREIWPKSENFGHTYDRVHKQLKAMFMSTTEEEWNLAYLEGKEILRSYPNKLSLLETVYLTPSYYAGYYTRKIPCSLDLNGSAIAEINHSSVVAHLGPGGLQTTMEQLSKLLTRQQHLYNKEREYQDKSRVSFHLYKSKFFGSRAIDDKKCKEKLSTYAHKELFQVALENSESLSHKVNSDGVSHVVWPTGNIPQQDNSKTIYIGSRCNCLFRIMYDCQCKHEFAINPSFQIDHWNKRHYNNTTFNGIYPEVNIHNTRVNQSQLDNDVVSPNCNYNHIDLTDDSNMYDTLPNQLNGSSCDKVVDPFSTTKLNVSYNELMNTATELCRTVSTNQRACRSVYVTMKEWIERIRSKEPFDVKFERNTLICINDNIDSNDNMPQAATFSSTNSQRLGKRYKSCRENNLSIYHKNNTNNDEQFLSPTKKKPKHNTCALCNQPRCAKWKCARLLEYNVSVLSKNNVGARISFGNKLVIPEEFNPERRDACDTRPVLTSMPTNIKAIIVHRKLLIKNSVITLMNVDNMCIEVTLLTFNGEKMDGYHLVLFTPGIVAKSIMQSKNSLIGHKF